MTMLRQIRMGSRRGNIAVLAAALMVVLFVMVAFAVDVGYIADVQTELQRTADASALAAAARLPTKTDAIAIAKQVAQNNKGVEGPTLANNDIVFGYWDRRAATFTANASKPNAVQVTVKRTNANGNPLHLFFAGVFGHDYASIDATAIAMYEKSFCGPLVGLDWVEVPGDAETDSFYSSDGSYMSQTPGHNGSVCSDGPITADGSPIIDGNANPGRGQVTTLSGGAVVTGNMTPRLRPLNLPPVDASSHQNNNDNSLMPLIKKGNNWVSPITGDGSFLLDGGKTYTLPPGTYYMNNLTLTGQSTLNVTGTTVIYLTGSLDTAGGYLVNQTQVASNLQILMQGGPSTTAIVTGNVDIYAVVYAPNTAVEIRGGGQFFGAAVGKTLLATGTGNVHYDETLDLAIEDLPSRIALVK